MLKNVILLNINQIKILVCDILLQGSHYIALLLHYFKVCETIKLKGDSQQLLSK